MAELNTAASEKQRYNQHMELVRVHLAFALREPHGPRGASPFRRRLGLCGQRSENRADGNLPGSDVQIVDGLPVYNAW